MEEQQKPEAKLRKLYLEGGSWRVLFDALATYSNRRSALSAERAQQGTALPYNTVIRLFRELAALKIGEFKYGRHKQKTRLIWRFSPKSVGEVAAGRAAGLEPYEGGTDDDQGEEPAGLQTGAAESPAGQAIMGERAIIQNAKLELARQLGLSPDRIEITVRY